MTATVPIASLGRVVTGSTPPAKYPEWFADEGMPFLTPSDIDDARRNVETVRFLSPEGARAMAKRVVPQGAVCFVSIGSTIGKMCSPSAPSVTNQQINTLVVDLAKGDPTFIYYALVMRAAHIRGIAGGSATPILNKTAFSSVEIDVLPVAAQRSVGRLLDALDNKIASNHRLVELAPRLIRARVAAALGESCAEVPVASLASFVNGGAYTKGASGTGRMVIRIADLNSGPGPSTVYNNIEVPDDKTARPGDILMSWSGSLGVYRWCREEAIINQHIFKVLPAGYPDWLVFDRLGDALATFQGIAKDKATTMGHIQRGHLESTSVNVPTTDAIESLDRDLSRLWARLLVAERECLRLERLRDALLPELLSGRLRVSDARETTKTAM